VFFVAFVVEAYSRFPSFRRLAMTKWSKLKAVGLFSSTLLLGGFSPSCIGDLLQDVLVGILFD
jgi:hypothetical protein